MQISNLKAQPNAAGGRIDLSWTADNGFTGVKVLRRRGFFPSDLDIQKALQNPASLSGVQVFDAVQPGSFSDLGLRSETIYYYAVAGFTSPNNYVAAFASAMATGAFQTSAYLYGSLPGIYQSLDTVLPPNVALLDPADAGKGQLRRFVEMFGQQFDLLRSFAGGTRDLYDPSRIEGSLLPLLAGWIGWPTDFTLDFSKQRNEIGYATHYQRTVGIAANIRATINRLVTWDAQIKEFVHNVFLTNAPEQLVIYQIEKNGGALSPQSLVTIDVAYEGRPSAVRSADGRDWIFYHARQSAAPAPIPGNAGPAQDQWNLWFKAFDEGEWLAARPLSFDGDSNKYPAAIQRRDGKWWITWTYSRPVAGQRVAEIRVRPFDVGRDAKPARLDGTKSGPYAFSDGDVFRIVIKNGSQTLDRTVTVRAEHFVNIAAASADEVATLLDAELPGVTVTVRDNGALSFSTLAVGQQSVITLPASAVASSLGPFTATLGIDAQGARITGNSLNVSPPFPLSDNDTLSINIDGDQNEAVTFNSANFLKIGAATTQEVVDEINRALPGVADIAGNLIRLTSPTKGSRSFISVDIENSTAAARLGFGASMPGSGTSADDSEPAVFEDNANRLWVFFSSFRDGQWRIWYNQFTVNGWGAAKPLTSGIQADHQPSVVFDSGGGGPNQGKIWIFWTRQKSNGRLNIMYRTTTKIDFAALVDADWIELELTPVPAGDDRREPAPLLLGPDNLELYFSANQTDGWHIWVTTLTPAPAAVPTQITTRQFTHRAPAVTGPLRGTRLLYRSDESQVYVSPLYPASRTIDARYGGSTTVDTRNPEKIGLRGQPSDVMRYTYDTGTRQPGKELDAQLYSRDTIGIYLIPDTDNQELILRKREAMANIVRSVLPIQVRAVFLIQQVNVEFVYTFDQPGAKPPVLIGEEVVDTILGEVLSGVNDSFQDQVNFRFVRSWNPAHRNISVPNLKVLPPDLSFRLFMSRVQEGV
jgi:phage tail-like protein